MEPILFLVTNEVLKEMMCVSLLKNVIKQSLRFWKVNISNVQLILIDSYYTKKINKSFDLILNNELDINYGVFKSKIDNDNNGFYKDEVKEGIIYFSKLCRINKSEKRIILIVCENDSQRWIDYQNTVNQLTHCDCSVCIYFLNDFIDLLDKNDYIILENDNVEEKSIKILCNNFNGEIVQSNDFVDKIDFSLPTHPTLNNDSKVEIKKEPTDDWLNQINVYTGRPNRWIPF